MTDYPVSLALEDFVPVAFATIGVVLLSRHLRTRFGAGAQRTALLAAVFVGGGGLCKSTWKLIVALDGPDLTWLESLLFPLMLIGFTLLVRALYPEPVRTPHRALTYALAAIPVVGLLASALLGATWPAMVLMILAVSVAAVRLSLLARADGDTVAAALFGIWLTIQYVLGPLAARPDQTIGLQWVEQGLNTAAQGAFAYAALRLARTSHTSQRKETVAP